MASTVKPILLCATILSHQTYSTLASIKTDSSKNEYYRKVTGMVLVGHVISTHQVTSPMDCSFLCAANHKCKSSNYKPTGAGHQHVCQLNNATRRTTPASYKADVGFVHYYRESEDFRSCLDYLGSGVQENGIYTITDTTGTSYPVFCDLTSEPRSAWTLISSMTLKNRMTNGNYRTPLSMNLPIQENTPNWKAYRLSLSRMQHLTQQSTHVRITTGFTSYGVDFRDYLRAKLSSLNPMTYQGTGSCMKVEYIDVRGNKGSDVTVPFWQRDGIEEMHTDSTQFRCQFDSRSGSVNNEDNFGLYMGKNTNFRGTANDESMTEIWFGRYL